MRELIFSAFGIGAISWVYHIVLREKLLSGWFRWGWKKFGQRDDWTYIFYEPIFNCEKCFAGQLALWSFLFSDSHNAFTHLVFIALSIFFVTLITKWTN